MITFILTLHLALAALYTLSIIGMTFAAAFRKDMPVIRSSAAFGFAATIGSGAVLVVVSPKTVMHFCLSAVIATVFGTVAWMIYRQRIVAFNS